MVQNRNNVEYQDFNPSPLHHASGAKRCNLGANQEGEVIIVQEDRSVIDWDQLRRVWKRTRPARKVAGIAAPVLLGVGLALLGMAWIGVLVYRAGQWCWQLITDNAQTIGIGAAVLLFVLIVVFVVRSVRSAVPFDDWQPTAKPNKRTDRQIVINQVVNINDK